MRKGVEEAFEWTKTAGVEFANSGAWLIVDHADEFCSENPTAVAESEAPSISVNPRSFNPSIPSSHSYLSASIGSRREALTAGYMPKKMPTEAEKPRPMANDHHGREMGKPDTRCTA